MKTYRALYSINDKKKEYTNRLNSENKHAKFNNYYDMCRYALKVESKIDEYETYGRVVYAEGVILNKEGGICRWYQVPFLIYKPYEKNKKIGGVDILDKVRKVTRFYLFRSFPIHNGDVGRLPFLDLKTFQIISRINGSINKYDSCYHSFHLFGSKDFFQIGNKRRRFEMEGKYIP